MTSSGSALDRQPITQRGLGATTRRLCHHQVCDARSSSWRTWRIDTSNSDCRVRRPGGHGRGLVDGRAGPGFSTETIQTVNGVGTQTVGSPSTRAGGYAAVGVFPQADVARIAHASRGHWSEPLALLPRRCSGSAEDRTVNVMASRSVGRATLRYLGRPSAGATGGLNAPVACRSVAPYAWAPSPAGRRGGRPDAAGETFMVHMSLMTHGFSPGVARRRRSSAGARHRRRSPHRSGRPGGAGRTSKVEQNTLQALGLGV